jgi:hypothetical protein
MAATFGALLTELRDNSRLLREYEGLVFEVETEMMWSNHGNPRRAYAAVTKRRESPNADDDFAEEAFDPSEKLGTEYTKEERQAMFDDFARTMLGIDPERLGKAEYTKLFTKFESSMFKGDPQVSGFQPDDREKASAVREDARIKEVYRDLVRRLHPDLRTDGGVTVSATWHEVQEAYQARNLDRLESLLALTEMGSGASSQASFSQIQRALADFKRSLRAIQWSLREAKWDPAWGFSLNPPKSSMERRIRREMEETLSHQRSALAELKRTIEDWSRPWHPPVKKPKQQSKPPEKPKTEKPRPDFDKSRPVQTEFSAFR